MKNNKTKKIQSDFANLTSHQLRTPLSGTKWLLELLQKSDTGNLTKKQKDFIEKLNVENERIISLVNNLLEVSRIEEGSVKLYRQQTDLASVMKSLLKEKEKDVKKKQLQISLDIQQEPLPLVSTELNKIKQAINNIISNSIVYTHAGGKISITLKVSGDVVLASIADNGIGIPKSEQKEIFSKFFRGSNVRTIEAAGTGLGLYIAKAFIEASHGKLWFKSEAGKGTTFYFNLPIAK